MYLYVFSFCISIQKDADKHIEEDPKCKGMGEWREDERRRVGMGEARMHAIQVKWLNGGK